MRKDCVMGLNIPGYTLFCAGGIDRLIACILARNMNIWMLLGFSSMDLVAVQIKYYEGEAERSLVACSAYLPFDSEDLPPTTEFEELVYYCEEKNLHLIMGCDSNCHHTVWDSTNCNDKRSGVVGISKFYKFGNTKSRQQPYFLQQQEVRGN